MDLGFYYSNRDVTFAKSDKILYVTIRIPLSSVSTFFDLYSVISAPVPCNSSTDNSTKIENLHPYFAVTRDSSHHMTLSHEIVAYCSGTEVKRCSHVMSIRTSIVVDSCEYALYFDRPKVVLQLCDIRFQNQGLLERVIQLKNNRFLASAIAASWTFTCHRKSPEPIRSCKFCILLYHATCGIHAPTFVIHSKYHHATIPIRSQRIYTV